MSKLCCVIFRITLIVMSCLSVLCTCGVILCAVYTLCWHPVNGYFHHGVSFPYNVIVNIKEQYQLCHFSFRPRLEALIDHWQPQSLIATNTSVVGMQ